MVVAGERASVRRDEQHRRGEHGQRDAGAAAAAEGPVEPADEHEAGPECGGAVQVPPDGEQWEAPEHAVGGPPRVLDEQPEARDEGQIGEALRANLPRAADQAEEPERQEQEHARAAMRRAAGRRRGRRRSRPASRGHGSPRAGRTHRARARGRGRPGRAIAGRRSPCPRPRSSRSRGAEARRGGRCGHRSARAMRPGSSGRRAGGRTRSRRRRCRGRAATRRRGAARPAPRAAAERPGRSTPAGRPGRTSVPERQPSPSRTPRRSQVPAGNSSTECARKREAIRHGVRLRTTLSTRQVLGEEDGVDREAHERHVDRRRGRRRMPSPSGSRRGRAGPSSAATGFRRSGSCRRRRSRRRVSTVEKRVRHQ